MPTPDTTIGDRITTVAEDIAARERAYQLVIEAGSWPVFVQNLERLRGHLEGLKAARGILFLASRISPPDPPQPSDPSDPSTPDA